MNWIWIRSQDQGTLMCCSAVILNRECSKKINGIGCGWNSVIGWYDAEERAMEVLNEIHKRIRIHDHDVYQMPKE